MEQTKKVVITLPAYRAERTLAQTVADIPEGVHEELILVDDASSDNTAALARSLGIRVHVHPKNRGYGGNQKTCYQLALSSGADVVVLLHPDYQYEPKAVPLLIAPILAGDADMTFGSRFAGLGDPRSGGMPLYRFVGNRLTTVIQNLLLGTRFTEMHSGMRAYTRDCLLSLPFRGYPDDFLFDAELLIDAVTSGQRVVEVPIPTRYTKESSSIAVSPSIKYVTGGLAHAWRRSVLRGRRRRISVATMDVEPGGKRSYEFLLDLAAAFFRSSSQMKVEGAAPAEFRSMASSAGFVETDGDIADLVFAFSSAEAPPHALIASAADALSDDGLLLIAKDHGDGLALSPTTEILEREGVRVVGSVASSRRDVKGDRRLLVIGRAAPRTSPLRIESGRGGLGSTSDVFDPHH